MRRNEQFSTLMVILITVFNGKNISYAEPTAMVNMNSEREEEMIVEAGCGPWGKLLSKGACLIDGYQKSIPPLEEDTNVYLRMTEHRVREVQDRKKMLTVDCTVTGWWVDPGIKTNFSAFNIRNDGIWLPPELTKMTWGPDFYMTNLADIKTFTDSYHVKSFRLLPRNPFNQLTTLVEIKVTFRVILHCNFGFSRYPMDSQNCNVRIYSRQSYKSRYLYYDPYNVYPYIKTQEVDGFNITMTLFGENFRKIDNGAGFDVHLDRLLKPFLFKYYLPCIAIVIASSISFIIPLTAIPGRVALVVTLFLSLLNLFIYEMVRIQ